MITFRAQYLYKSIFYRNRYKIILFFTFFCILLFSYISYSVKSSYVDLDERISHMRIVGEKFTQGLPYHIVDKECIPEGYSELSVFCLEEHLYSWRYTILPYLTPTRPYLDQTKNWNSMENSYTLWIFFHQQSFIQMLKAGVFTPNGMIDEKTINELKNSTFYMFPYCYEKPSSYYKSMEKDCTNILSIKGENTVLSPQYSPNWQYAKNLHSAREKTTSENTAFPPSLLVLIEVGDSKIHWADPFDIEIEYLEQNKDDSRFKFGLDSKGFLVYFWDGQILYLKHNTPKKLLAKFANVNSSTDVSREEAFGPYIIPY